MIAGPAICHGCACMCVCVHASVYSRIEIKLSLKSGIFFSFVSLCFGFIFFKQTKKMLLILFPLTQTSVFKDQLKTIKSYLFVTFYLFQFHDNIVKWP